MEKIERVIAIVLLLLLKCLGVYSQSPDTLSASVVSSHLGNIEISKTVVDLSSVNCIISPSGGGDIVKSIQLLPGVSSGAEGTSSYYVRGGNFGNNLVTVDNVRIMGTGHLLGLTSAYSPDVISKAELRKGGFDGDHVNMTASALSLETKNGSFSKFSGYCTLSNFMAGVGVSCPMVKDRMSLLLSVRYSPAKYEYGLIRRVAMNSGSDLPDDVNISVHDMFAKISWKHESGASTSLSMFESHDAYGYGLEDDGHDNLGWDNFTVNFRHAREVTPRWSYSGNASFSHYGNYQTQNRTMSGVDNSLGISTDIINASSAGQFTRTGRILHRTGYNVEFSSYAPGVYSTAADSGSKSYERTLMANLWYQIEKSIEDLYSLKIMARGDIYIVLNDYESRPMLYPEGSISWSQHVARNFGYEVSADYVVQYFHLLEGLPTGWSADMLVPANKINKPETSAQGFAGLFYCNKTLNISVGPYYKWYNAIVYYPDAVNLFRSVQSGWRNGIYSGKGTSYGIESNCDLNMGKLQARVSYTYSKSMRYFANVNAGVPFHAKFDRPHMLNMFARYDLQRKTSSTHGISSTFSLQSGHLESLKNGSYVLNFLDAETVVADFYGAVNNYRMPTYMRLDVGYYLGVDKGRFHHKLNVGVYNILNRHNPMCLYYNSKSREWQQLSLFPIMPSFSYKIEF